ncbi:MAG TPA: HEAT repeat domain-containing protein [Polyangiaceae bacterium]|jgi:HEAT repeat protein
MKRHVVSLALVLAATAANAQTRSGGATNAPQVKVSATAGADLKSGDTTKVKAALDEIRMAGKGTGTPFAPQIVDLLQKGVTVQIAEAAIDTLGDLEDANASPAIAEYMQHRSPRVRQAVAKALVKTKGPAAVKALSKGLSDQDGMVRGVSANGLGQLKAKSAVADLFLALDHRVNEAGVSIGMICSAQECEQLATRIGKFPFDVIAGGIEQALFRADVPDDTKIKLVGRIRELGTKEANASLKEWFKKWPANGSARVKQALDQAVQATGGGS